MNIDNIARQCLDRRAFIKASSAGGIAALAGCTGGNDSEDIDLMDIEEIPSDEYEDQLNVWNWYVQWVEWGTQAFAEEYEDVSPTTEAYSQPTQWFSQLQAGDHDIDHIGTNSEWMARAADAGFLAEIPADRLPNWDHLDDEFTDPIVEELSGENGGVYGVPHSITVFPALVYNDEYFDEPPDSWDVLWEDEFADQMAILAHYSSAPGILGALYTGQDPNDPNDFDEIEEVLINQKDLLTTYANEHESHMQSFINEEIILGTHTSGRINIANYTHDADHVSWTVPEGGSLFNTNEIAIPADAPNPRASLNFLNFMLSEDALTEFANLMNYKVPLQNQEEILAEDDRIPSDFIDVVSWGDIDVDNLDWNGPLDDEAEQRYDEVWTNVQAA